MANSEIKFDDREVVKFFEKLTKNKKDITDGQKAFAGAIGAIVFSDVIRHFENESGPNGKWKDLSPFTKYSRSLTGHWPGQILQVSGTLRKSFTPGAQNGSGGATGYRPISEGIIFFNDAKTKSGYPYAAAHDEGDGRLPQRQFMWLSKNASDNIGKVTLGYLLNGIGD